MMSILPSFHQGLSMKFRIIDDRHGKSLKGRLLVRDITVTQDLVQEVVSASTKVTVPNSNYGLVVVQGYVAGKDWLLQCTWPGGIAPEDDEARAAVMRLNKDLANAYVDRVALRKRELAEAATLGQQERLASQRLAAAAPLLLAAVERLLREHNALTVAAGGCPGETDRWPEAAAQARAAIAQATALTT